MSPKNSSKVINLSKKDAKLEKYTQSIQRKVAYEKGAFSLLIQAIYSFFRKKVGDFNPSELL